MNAHDTHFNVKYVKYGKPKIGDKVICTNASGGIVGWLTQGQEYVVERCYGVDVKFVGCEYTSKLWRFKLKEK